jgi:hypothetical protein
MLSNLKIALLSAKAFCDISNLEHQSVDLINVTMTPQIGTSLVTVDSTFYNHPKDTLIGNIVTS